MQKIFQIGKGDNSVRSSIEREISRTGNFASLNNDPSTYGKPKLSPPKNLNLNLDLGYIMPIKYSPSTFNLYSTRNVKGQSNRGQKTLVNHTPMRL